MDILETIVQESENKNEDKDCAVRALAIATDYTYDDVHYVFELCGRVHRQGTSTHMTKRAAKMLRFSMIDVTDWYEARTVRTLERELGYGRYIVRVNRHMLPIVNGRVYDWTKGRLHRILEIYKVVETDIEFHERNMV